MVNYSKMQLENQREYYKQRFKTYQKSGYAELQSKFPIDPKKIEQYFETKRSKMIKHSQITTFEEIGLPDITFPEDTEN